MHVHQLGVMQGRLLPKYQGRYQAHPVGYWQREFALAAEFNLKFIEFILDYNDVEANPLSTAAGLDNLSEVIAKSGVGVRSICADYFMEAPLHRAATRDKSALILRGLIEAAPQIGVRDIIIPCVDQASLKTSSDQVELIASLRDFLPLADLNDVNLALETDLGPRDFANLIERFASRRVTVNYDTGNSAASGFRPQEEINAYGHAISEVHIKDRKRGGGSTVLGTGDTNFKEFFRSLDPAAYRGIFIMQAFRDDDGVSIFKSQLEWIKGWLSEWTAK